MSKKIISAALAIAMVAVMCFVGVLSASADETVYGGDQVKYIFSVAPLNDVGGMTVYSTYDPGKLTYVSSEYIYAEGMGAVNDLNEGAVNWNDTFATGLNTSNTDIFCITFDVRDKAAVSELGLSSNCLELFDVNAIDIAGDFNSLVTARVEVIHNSTPDTDTQGTDTGNTSSKDETIGSDVTIDSDVSSAVSSTTSAITSSTTSSAVSSAKTTTPDPTKPTSSVASNAGTTSTGTTSSASSSAATSSKPAISSAASASTTSTVPTVKTAGTVAIISLVIVLMAAAAIVFFSKKNANEE